MKPILVVPGVYRIPFGFVNAYLIDRGGLTLVDCGYPGSEAAILESIQAIGRKPEDLNLIVLTHFHADHSGGAAALQARTGAELRLNDADSVDYAMGLLMRPMQAGPGLLNRLIAGGLMRMKLPEPRIARISGDLRDGEILPFSGGLRVVASPGHTAGHCALLWPYEGGVLFSGDSFSAMFGLGYSPIYEDLELGRSSLAKLSGLEFDTLCPSHGKPIVGGADKAFRERWSTP